MRCGSISAGLISVLLGHMDFGRAGVIRDDVADSFYTNLAAQSVYDSVGFLTWSEGASGYIASGTLISPEWVLTAGHVVGGTNNSGAGISGMIFGLGGTVSGTVVSVLNLIPYAGWSSSGGNLWSGVDLGLVRLSQPITSVTPAQIDFRTSSVGLLGTNVGYGRGGDGTGGMTTDAGTKRAGQNMIDARGGMVTTMGSGTLLDLDGISPTVLFQDFDHPTDLVASSMGSAIPMAQEYLIGSGDSGGGLFIEVGGVTKLVGVHSFLASLPYPLDTTGANADYGDLAGSVSVQSFENWILTTTGVPEPSAGGLLLGAFTLWVLTKKRGGRILG
ncbi:MAG: trypsin-like serine protease [Verrucomicrobia bacterium]|nr:trypsin-like serine protease [Verrucomicrobiota bacterium]